MSSCAINDFLSPPSSSIRAAPRVQSAYGNYVVSLRKPTAVTHSCYGNFTGPKDLNLVICKVSLVSIYLMTENGLEHLREFPMYGRVVFMELSHVNHLKKDILFIATEAGTFCMFEWDVKASNVISLDTIFFTPNVVEHDPMIYEYYDFCQGGTVSNGETTIVLYSKINHLRIVDINDLGLGKSRFEKILSSTNILDVKFLKSYEKQLALLYRGIDGNFYSGIFEITDDDVVAISLFQPDQTIRPTLLIPNLFSFLIIGKKGVVYYGGNEIKTKFLGYFDIQAYGRVDENVQMCRYLLGGHDGHLLVIEIKVDSAIRLSGLTVRPLGKTSVASSITYLCNDIVYVGSRYADSQLVKMHQLHEPSLSTNTPALHVLKTYTNSGPVIDFSLSNKPGGVRKLVMCCGTHADSFLESVSTGVGINEKLSAEIPGIKRIWSLKSLSSDVNHAFLVLQPSLCSESIVLTVDNTGALITHTMEGFSYDSVTVCCHNADNRRFIQVTEKSVRLIDSKTGVLCFEWLPSSKILFASATIKQVLLATSDQQLVYLDIKNGKIVKGKAQEVYGVSCLDIGPIGTNTSYSKLAAVGLWQNSIMVIRLPELIVLTVEQVKPHVPLCIQLCAFEQVSYLLCALGDETLLTFKLNEDNGQLQEKNTKELMGYAKTLRTFISNGVVRVFFSSLEVPKLISTKKQELQYNRLNLSEVEDMCPFQHADISEGLAIVTKHGVVICTLGDMETNFKIPMLSYGRHLCKQEESQTYAILVEEKDRRHFVQLLDKEFNTTFSFGLNELELGLSIVSCSFAGDDNAYYCVGIEVNPAQGRILVFIVRDGELDIVSQVQTNGAVYYLKGLNGGLLATVSVISAIHYFEWQLDGDARELHLNSDLAGIDSGGWEESYALNSSRIQKFKYGAHDINTDIQPIRRLDTIAMLMLQNETLFYADRLYNIFSGDKINNLSNPTMVGKWYSGEFITQMKAENLLRLSDEKYAQAPSIMFSTMSGAVGVIVSLPPQIYGILDKLEQLMRKKMKGKGCPDQHWPRMCIELSDFSDSKGFIDRDFIESFQTLTLNDQESFAQKMELSVDDIQSLVSHISFFH